LHFAFHRDQGPGKNLGGTPFGYRYGLGIGPFHVGAWVFVRVWVWVPFVWVHGAYLCGCGVFWVAWVRVFVGCGGLLGIGVWYYLCVMAITWEPKLDQIRHRVDDYGGLWLSQERALLHFLDGPKISLGLRDLMGVSQASVRWYTRPLCKVGFLKKYYYKRASGRWGVAYRLTRDGRHWLSYRGYIEGSSSPGVVMGSGL